MFVCLSSRAAASPARISSVNKRKILRCVYQRSKHPLKINSSSINLLADWTLDDVKSRHYPADDDSYPAGSGLPVQPLYDVLLLDETVAEVVKMIYN